MKALLIACVLILSLSLNADDLKDDLLRIHATIIPKLMMMDYDFEQRLIDDSISIAIVYDNNHQEIDAAAFVHYIEAKYPHGFQHHKIKHKFYSYKKIASAKKHTLYYLLPTSEANIKDTLEIAQNQKALSFSYRADDLKYGVMFSIKITNNVKPIINVDALKNTDVTLRPILMKVAEIYYQTSLVERKILSHYAFNIV